MSDKPTPRPSAGKTAGASGVRPLPAGDPDEAFDFLANPKTRGELGRLDHYRVLKVLGRGGMGIVFMAEDTRLHRVVALKVMLPSIARKSLARDRFLTEARATAAIEHDHIVTIYEVSREDVPVPYLAMQFLKGMSLEDWLKAGKTLNVPQCMRIGKEIAKGLAAAHARQLIHRDIKPSNIWLDAVNKGRVKILDFGLARPTNRETHLTQEGMILGSPAYMSPEQARGENIDERCDLFSLGCVLYRLLAGRLPFVGKDALAMLLEITTKNPPPVAELNPEVPAALADLVHRLLAKNPADRPASAKEVVQTIQDIERAWIAGARTQALPKPASSKAATFGAKDIDVEPVLEDSAITELELQASKSTESASSGGRAWIFAGLTGVLFGIVAIMCCAGILFATDVGWVEVHADEIAGKLIADPGLSVRDAHDKLHPLDLHAATRLPTGEYSIDASELPKSLHFEPSKFDLERMQTVKISVTYAVPKIVRPVIALLAREDARRLQREWAEYLQQKPADANSIGMKLAFIPPGEFLMGSSEEQLRQHLGELKAKKLLGDYEKRVAFEKPQHRVRISRPFYLSATEVTVGQFAKFVTADKKKHLTEPEIKGGGQGIEPGKEPVRKPVYNWNNTGFKQDSEQPVCNITWKDAEAFCDWLSKKEGKTYRLPTEAEWEYACRAGTTTLWNFGDKVEGFAERPWSLVLNKDAKPLTTHPVARKKDNDFGLFDMHGNVAEMCADYWMPTYYEFCAKEALTIDPKGPKGIAKAQRAVRGGSFLDPVQMARSAYRSGIDPGFGYVNIGFRVVCEIAAPAE